MTAKLWWIIHKDLVCEYRSRQVWPAMLLLGVVVAMVFGIQMQLPAEQKRQMAGSLLWLAIFFSGMLALDRSFTAEREDGCWEGLLLYPVAPAAIYLAKLAVNVVCLAVLELLLVPLFVVLADVPLLAHPWAMLLVALLGNLGIAAVGTLLGALTAGLRHGSSLSALLILPLVVPVVLAAAEATRLLVAGDFGATWWRWTELLGAFAVVFSVAGLVLFDFVVEE